MDVPAGALLDNRGEYAALGASIELGDDQSCQLHRGVERLYLCEPRPFVPSMIGI